MSADTRGIAKFDIDSVKKQIIENKKNVDILVINLHWGIEYFHLPTTKQIAYARNLVDFGADIIIGHHPHISQGVEKYKNGIIAYSLGNFIFSDIKWDWKTEGGDKIITILKFLKRHRDSIILQIVIGNNFALDYEIIGTYLSKSGQVLNQNKRSVVRMKYLSDVLKRSDYVEYFQRELKKFNRKKIAYDMFCRFKRIYKVRPKHIKELKEVLCKIVKFK